MTGAEMTCAIGIVAHESRLIEAWDLMLGSQASFLSVDDGSMGPSWNHYTVWSHLASEPTEWSLVLEDDAELCDGFLEQLEAVLAVAPSDVVSLYLGTGYPKAWQDFIAHVDSDPAHWGIAHSLIHGVAVAMRTHLVPDMVKWIAGYGNDFPVDEAIGEYCRAHATQVAYTRPSIVDHKDAPSVIDHTADGGRELPRRAWHFGTRQAWNKTSVTIL